MKLGASLKPFEKKPVKRNAKPQITLRTWIDTFDLQ